MALNLRGQTARIKLYAEISQLIIQAGQNSINLRGTIRLIQFPQSRNDQGINFFITSDESPKI